MDIKDFKIGEEFFGSAGFKWRCTDIGTRTITAIQLTPDTHDPSWYVGPPYAVAEVVFDEYDLPSCYLNFEDEIEDRMDSFENSGHPGYPAEDVFKMMREKTQHLKDENYPRNKRNILKYDRVIPKGEIIHPYSVKKSKVTGWNVCVYLPFLNAFKVIPENKFITLPIASKEDIKKRSLKK
jgi:hypothetical protein